MLPPASAPRSSCGHSLLQELPSGGGWSSAGVSPWGLPVFGASRRLRWALPREGHSWMGMATGAGSEQGCVPGFEVWWEPTSGGSREPGRSVAQLQLEAVRRSAGCWALSHRGPWETLRREDLPYRDISGRSGVGVFEPGCWQGVLFPLGCGFGGLPGVARRRRGNCSGILRRGFGKGLAWGPRQWHWHQLCASVAAVAAPCRDCAPQDRISQDLIHREVQVRV